MLGWVVPIITIRFVFSTPSANPRSTAPIIRAISLGGIKAMLFVSCMTLSGGNIRTHSVHAIKNPIMELEYRYPRNRFAFGMDIKNAGAHKIPRQVQILARPTKWSASSPNNFVAPIHVGNIVCQNPASIPLKNITGIISCTERSFSITTLVLIYCHASDNSDTCCVLFAPGSGTFFRNNSKHVPMPAVTARIIDNVVSSVFEIVVFPFHAKKTYVFPINVPDM